MKATIDLPEDVLRRAKSEAALRGRKLRELFLEGILWVLDHPELTGGQAAPIRRRSLPVIIPPKGIPLGAASPEDLRQIEEDEDEVRHARLA